MHRFKIVMGLIISSLVLLFGYRFSVTQAKTVNIIHDELYKAVQENNLLSNVNQTITNNGITVTINDIYYFGNNVLLSYTVMSKDKIENVDKHSNEIPVPNFYNGHKRIYGQSKLEIEKVNQNKIQGIVSINPHDKLPKNFNLTVDYKYLLNTSGEWMFKIPIHEVKGKIIKVNKVKSYEGKKLKINYLTINPVETNVVCELIEPSGIHDINFDMYSNTRKKSKILNTSGYSTSGEDKNRLETMHLVLKFSTLRNAKYLILTPFFEPGVNNIPSKKDISELKFKIPLG